MTDYLHKALKWVSYNRWVFAALIVAVGLIATSVGGCEATTTSPFSGGDVSRTQLDAEAQAWAATQKAKLESIKAASDGKQAAIIAAESDLQRQEEAIDGVLAAISEYGVPASGPYAPLLAAGIGILGGLLGRRADSKRKDAVIINLKNGGGT